MAYTLLALALVVFPSQNHAASFHQQDGALLNTANAVVAQIHFADTDELNEFASYLDIWEVDHENSTFTALLSADEQAALSRAGKTVNILPEKTASLYRTPRAVPQQASGIPAYPCYRTVEETYRDLLSLATDYPQLASWIDIGDTWEKSTPGGAPGYDIYALVLTNTDVPGPKPKLAVMSAIHAREYTTTELATRFAESLIAGYGSDPNITWLLDYHELHLIPYGNPDGRKKAEIGYSWRKNTHYDPTALCSSFSFGVDLNRNSSFRWNQCEGSGCSSGNACYITYRGTSPVSEPETQTIEAYLASIFDDQRGPGDTDAAPVDTEGAFISIHSYSELILYPWGWTDTPAPNGSALQTLARKFGYFTGYEVCQLGAPSCLYLADGTTDDWSYGTLGVASYTFELGTAFFEQCSVFEEDILENGIESLRYAMKASRRPYQTPSGPEVLNISQSASLIEAGEPVTITAVADDSRFDSNGHGEEPAQAIVAARYSIDAPSWITGTETVSMTVIPDTASAQAAAPADHMATIMAEIDTTDWAGGRHTVLIEAQDADGNWGVPSAIFIDVAKQDYFFPMAEQRLD